MTSKVRIAITAIEILNLTDEEIMYLRGSLHTSAEIASYDEVECECSACGCLMSNHEEHHCMADVGCDEYPLEGECINCYAPISECTCRSVTFNVEDFMEPHLESDEDRLERYSEYEDNN